MMDVLREIGGLLGGVAVVVLWLAVWLGVPFRMSRDERLHPELRSWIAGVALLAPVISLLYLLWLGVSRGGTRPTLIDFPRNPGSTDPAGYRAAPSPRGARPGR
ncbi:MAG: hypothetical protein LC722_08185 [Actinobacteria bacterium]|nr:hypothetical protein [Actinomycetota bacterium]